MTHTIRHYTSSDYSMIKSWWDAANEMPPTPGMLTLDSTFILEDNKVPTLCITLYMTNCREVAYLENFVGNPECKGSRRRELANSLLQYMYDFAKAKGFHNVVALTYKDSLVKRYEEFGLVQTCSNLTSFGKRL